MDSLQYSNDSLYLIHQRIIETDEVLNQINVEKKERNRFEKKYIKLLEKYCVKNKEVLNLNLSWEKKTNELQVQNELLVKIHDDYVNSAVIKYQSACQELETLNQTFDKFKKKVEKENESRAKKIKKNQDLLRETRKKLKDSLCKYEQLESTSNKTIFDLEQECTKLKEYDAKRSLENRTVEFEMKLGLIKASYESEIIQLKMQHKKEKKLLEDESKKLKIKIYEELDKTKEKPAQQYNITELTVKHENEKNILLEKLEELTRINCEENKQLVNEKIDELKNKIKEEPKKVKETSDTQLDHEDTYNLEDNLYEKHNLPVLLPPLSPEITKQEDSNVINPLSCSTAVGTDDIIPIFSGFCTQTNGTQIDYDETYNLEDILHEMNNLPVLLSPLSPESIKQEDRNVIKPLSCSTAVGTDDIIPTFTDSCTQTSNSTAVGTDHIIPTFTDPCTRTSVAKIEFEDTQTLEDTLDEMENFLLSLSPKSTKQEDSNVINILPCSTAVGTDDTIPKFTDSCTQMSGTQIDFEDTYNLEDNNEKHKLLAPLGLESINQEEYRNVLKPLSCCTPIDTDDIIPIFTDSCTQSATQIGYEDIYNLEENSYETHNLPVLVSPFCFESVKQEDRIAIKPLICSAAVGTDDNTSTFTDYYIKTSGTEIEYEDTYKSRVTLNELHNLSGLLSPLALESINQEEDSNVTIPFSCSTAISTDNIPTVTDSNFQTSGTENEYEDTYNLGDTLNEMHNLSGLLSPLALESVKHEEDSNITKPLSCSTVIDTNDIIPTVTDPYIQTNSNEIEYEDTYNLGDTLNEKHNLSGLLTPLALESIKQDDSTVIKPLPCSTALGTDDIIPTFTDSNFQTSGTEIEYEGTYNLRDTLNETHNLSGLLPPLGLESIIQEEHNLSGLLAPLALESIKQEEDSTVTKPLPSSTALGTDDIISTFTDSNFQTGDTEIEYEGTYNLRDTVNETHNLSGLLSPLGLESIIQEEDSIVTKPLSCSTAIGTDDIIPTVSVESIIQEEHNLSGLLSPLALESIKQEEDSTATKPLPSSTALGTDDIIPTFTDSNFQTGDTEIEYEGTYNLRDTLNETHYLSGLLSPLGLESIIQEDSNVTIPFSCSTAISTDNIPTVTDSNFQTSGTENEYEDTYNLGDTLNEMHNLSGLLSPLALESIKHEEDSNMSCSTVIDTDDIIPTVTDPYIQTSNNETDYEDTYNLGDTVNEKHNLSGLLSPLALKSIKQEEDSIITKSNRISLTKENNCEEIQECSRTVKVSENKSEKVSRTINNIENKLIEIKSNRFKSLCTFSKKQQFLLKKIKLSNKGYRSKNTTINKRLKPARNMCVKNLKRKSSCSSNIEYKKQKLELFGSDSDSSTSNLEEDEQSKQLIISVDNKTNKNETFLSSEKNKIDLQKLKISANQTKSVLSNRIQRIKLLNNETTSLVENKVFKKPERSKFLTTKIQPERKCQILPPKLNKIDSVLAEKLISDVANMDWDKELISTVVNYLKDKDSATVARLIVNVGEKDFSQILDKSFTPPAPLLTSTQQKILVLLSQLEKHDLPNIYSNFLKEVERRLLSTSLVEVVHPLTRLFVGACKIKYQIEKVRTLCCDAAYYMGDLLLPIMFIVLTMWAEILPPADNSSDTYLAVVLVRAIHLKNCRTPGYNYKALNLLLRQYYGYKNENYNNEEIMIKLIGSYSGTYSNTAYTAILILCKNLSNNWTYDQIKRHMLPLLEKDNCSEKKSKTVSLILGLIKKFQVNIDRDKISDIKKCLSEHVNLDGAHIFHHN